MGVRMIFVLLWMVVEAASGFDIYSRSVKTTYSIFGGLESFIIEWKPTADIKADSLLKVSFPQAIHNGSQPLVYSIFNQFGESIAEAQQSLVPSSSIYYFQLPALSGSIWYSIQINVALTPSIGYGLIGLAVVSRDSGSLIQFESNMALEYYHLEAMGLPAENILINSTSVPSTAAGSVYPVSLSFFSSYTSNDSVTLRFLFSNLNYSLLSVSSSLIKNSHFKFTGACQLLCTNQSCIQQLSCQIVENQVRLILPYLDAEAYWVEAYVINPSFVDRTGIVVIVEEEEEGVKGIGIENDLFWVQEITILPAEVYLHWGIPLNVVSSQMMLGLFVGGGWNTIDIGFTLSSVTPIDCQFSVSLFVGASSVLEHSINSNLPALNGSSVPRCLYDRPYIICSPIDAFTSRTQRYYIRFKALFMAGDNWTGLGSVKIDIIGSSEQLFAELIQTLGIGAIAWADYHDYGGFHSGAYKMKETQVVGVADSGLANATSTFMDTLYSSNQFIGIDPQIPNQQLVFFLKTDLSKTSKAIANETYEMLIYFNPSVFSSFSRKGLDFTAFNSSSAKFQGDSPSCYVDSSISPTIQIYQCQAYNDYVYGQQIDNVVGVTEYFGVFYFVCGNGRVVVCPNGASCSQSCRVLKGKGSGQGQSGVFSIRGVTFKEGYQSPVEASSEVLDFIVVFYHGGQLVSASLLNAYTMKSSRLRYVSQNYLNVYLSPPKWNEGDRVPTLLSLSGHLAIAEGSRYDKFKVFLPVGLSVNRYLQKEGRVGCSHNCSSWQTNDLAAPLGCLDNWLCKQCITVTNVSNINIGFEIKIPVQIVESVVGSIELALLYQNKLVRVYRLNGSAVQQLLDVPISVVISQKNYTSQWVNAGYWVKTVSDVYRQGLDLSQLSQFVSSIVLNMNGSVLTVGEVPSLTFTSKFYDIFTPFTYVISNGLYECDSPFSYSYQMEYNLTVLWCPLVKNAVNQLVINYPFFNGFLGAGFPLQTVFAYGVSDGQELIAFRTETNVKSTKDGCSTGALTVYNYGEVIKQVVNLTITLATAVEMTSNGYSSLALRITLPLVIPVTFLSCRAEELVNSYEFGCTIGGQGSNIASFVLAYAGQQLMLVVSINLIIEVIASAAATAVSSTTYLYSVEIVLPQTDAAGNSTIFGTAYIPFSSIIQACSSNLPMVNIPPLNQPITLSNLIVSAVALNYCADLNWTVSFTHSRSILLPSSSIVISFVGASTTSWTECWRWQGAAFFFSQQVVSSNKVVLSVSEEVAGFSLLTYRMRCSGLIVSSNSLTVQMQWMDGASVLQSSNVLSFAGGYLSSISTTGSVLAKTYNTLGYDAEIQFQLSVVTISGDFAQIWVDVGKDRIHEMVLSCYSMINGVRTKVYCVSDWEDKVHIAFQAGTGSSVTFWVYGIKQQDTAVNTFNILASINKSAYKTAVVIDSLTPNILSSEPILIISQSLGRDFGWSIDFSFQVNYSSSIYLIIDDSLLVLPPQRLNCSIDGVYYVCAMLAPNLVIINSLLSLQAGQISSLKIWGLNFFDYDAIDEERINFKMFVEAGGQVIMGSHQHLDVPSLVSELSLPMETMQMWSYYDLNFTWMYHTVYVGYYSTPAILSLRSWAFYSHTTYNNYSSFFGLSFLNLQMIIELGEKQLQFELAAINLSDRSKLDYLQFSSQPLIYDQPPILPVYVSTQQCKVSYEYPVYELYPGGITIPMKLDFSRCRPIIDHYLTYSISSPKLSVDISLTNTIINATRGTVYLIVRQLPMDATVMGLFTLKTTIQGSYNSSFAAIPDVLLKVNSGTLNTPQSQVPLINEVTQDFVNFTLQCNQPATIYWALGLYPTIIGITPQEIEGKLTTGGIGITTPYFEPYSWSYDTYGLIYAPNANQNVNLVLGGLRGQQSYVFKYFCVNQMGYSQSGQLSYFTTPPSLYGLNKVTLVFPKMLTIWQANMLACYIAEVLVTPYRTVMTSTFSNCINTSRTYYEADNTTFFDENGSEGYRYHFYVDSVTIPIIEIRSSLPVLLSQYMPFKQAIMPFTDLKIATLINNYNPQIKATYLSVSTNGINFTVDVGVVNGYLIVGYIPELFDPQTMALPAHWLIKQGNLSAYEKFTKVVMRYGSNNITVNFTDLQPNKDYCLLYFVTVDDPALNSKATQVYYKNVQTFAYIIYYLGEKRWLEGLALIGAIVTILFMG